MRRPALLLSCVAASVLAVAGCGGSGSGVKAPTIQAAHTYHFSGFEPAGAVEPGKPVQVAFTIVQPNGRPLTDYKRGAGPHTGIHLIVVRNDLSWLGHWHPAIDANGKASQTIDLPAGGTYRVVVDAYPNVPASPLGLPTANSNFQLFETLHASGSGAAKPLAAGDVRTVGGLRVELHPHGRLHALQAATIEVTVTRNGKPARFTPYYGALAHAIFFRKGSLDYFHTHVCAPGATGCTSVLGGSRITGTSTTPGKLDVGVLLPLAGTWELFLQTRADGKLVTAPFTLEVS